MEHPQLRTVHFIDGTVSVGTLQGLYLDRAANWLRPNLSFVSNDDRFSFDINEMGLKGEPEDPNRKLAVVWGDSVVFGVGRGWPCLLDSLLPGYQFLNGGIEGNLYDQILERAVRFNAMHEVHLNLVFLGWHPIGHNQNVAVDLAAALPRLRNPVLLTIPTALNHSNAYDDLSASFVHYDDWLTSGFYFQDSDRYTMEWQRAVFEFIIGRNDIIRNTAQLLNLPLIDLFEAMNTAKAVDFREDFFDVYHPRSSAYPKIVHAIYEELRNFV